MAQKNVININPSVLAWARKESGMDMGHILKTLEIDHPTYQLWERFGNNIPFGKLKILAKIFQRQIAVFFLPEVPEKTERPIDNRNLKDFNAKLSPETSLSIRRANRYCELLNDLNPAPCYNAIYTWIQELRTTFYDPKRIDSEKITGWIRGRIGVSIDQQLAASSQSQAYRMWRAAFENNLGIPTFQFKMPVQEVQGFSLNNNVPYCIALNSRHSVTGRIFTLFHELGHLIKRQSGICFPEKVEDNQILELECNAFAGMLLIPGEIVKPLDSADDIRSFSNRLKVGSEVYLRRLKGLNMIDDRRFLELLSETEDRIIAPAKGFGRTTNIEKAVNSRGQHLFDSVAGAAANNRISYGLASDILGLKINHLLNY
ncbi:MAG: ImmA/IrrE family metallo-endopeptidase [Deltaproteobacteria bacterium]|nr:ImmA/IrrE family metallo-endopeptidase [Deltaproteobacteria bacterium]